MGGQAAEWLDRTVRVEKVASLTPEQWLGEFQRLKKLNAEITKGRQTIGSEAPDEESAR